jgi:hypothetical protein
MVSHLFMGFGFLLDKITKAEFPEGRVHPRFAISISDGFHVYHP